MVNIFVIEDILKLLEYYPEIDLCKDTPPIEKDLYVLMKEGKQAKVALGDYP